MADHAPDVCPKPKQRSGHLGRGGGERRGVASTHTDSHTHGFAKGGGRKARVKPSTKVGQQVRRRVGLMQQLIAGLPECAALPSRVRGLELTTRPISPTPRMQMVRSERLLYACASNPPRFHTFSAWGDKQWDEALQQAEMWSSGRFSKRVLPSLLLKRGRGKEGEGKRRGERGGEERQERGAGAGRVVHAVVPGRVHSEAQSALAPTPASRHTLP